MNRVEGRREPSPSTPDLHLEKSEESNGWFLNVGDKKYQIAKEKIVYPKSAPRHTKWLAKVKNGWNALNSIQVTLPTVEGNKVLFVSVRSLKKALKKSHIEGTPVSIAITQMIAATSRENAKQRIAFLHKQIEQLRKEIDPEVERLFQMLAPSSSEMRAHYQKTGFLDKGLIPSYLQSLLEVKVDKLNEKREAFKQIELELLLLKEKNTWFTEAARLKRAYEPLTSETLSTHRLNFLRVISKVADPKKPDELTFDLVLSFKDDPRPPQTVTWGHGAMMLKPYVVPDPNAQIDPYDLVKKGG